MNMLLHLHQVSKSYANNLALKDVSLDIPSGKIIGLLGPNGSGKTTLIKLINGLLQPNSGEILIDGMPPSSESKKIVSYLPDTTYWNDNMKICDALQLFQSFYDDFDRNKAIDLLNDLNLNISQRFKQLSKGNKEKVQLILVMSRQAKLYILDEPIGGVDPASREYILKTIIKNYSRQASVILSTHLISDIEKILDEVIFIKQGSIVLQGNVDDLRAEKGASIDQIFREQFKVVERNITC